MSKFVSSKSLQRSAISKTSSHSRKFFQTNENKNVVNSTLEDVLTIEERQVDRLQQIKDKIDGLKESNPSLFKPRSSVKSVKVQAPKFQAKSGGCSTCQIPITLVDDTSVDITSPGYYIIDCTTGDYHVNPSGLIPAIRILSPDVTLDLNGQTIRQVNTSDPFGYFLYVGYGLMPNPGPEQDFVAKNIKIKNGVIKNFTCGGILSYNSTYGAYAAGLGPSIQTPWENITVENVDVLDCGMAGWNNTFQGVQGIDISSDVSVPDTSFKNIAIRNCNVDGCVGNSATAVYVWRADGLTIDKVNADNVLTPDDSTTAGTYSTAAFYIEGRNLTLNNCHGDNCRDENTSVYSLGAQIGSFIQRSQNVILNECTFNYAYGERNSIVNLNTSNSKGLTATGCQFNFPSCGNDVVDAVGIHMSDSPNQTDNGQGFKFENCQFIGASSGPSPTRTLFVGGYIAITQTSVEFNNCQFGAVQFFVPDDYPIYAQAIGAFNLTMGEDPAYPYANVGSTIFRNCSVSDIKSNVSIVGLAGGSRYYYRARRPTGSNVTFEGNTINNLVSTSTRSYDFVVGLGNPAPDNDTTLFSLPAYTENFVVLNNTFQVIHHYPGEDRNATPNALVGAILIDGVQNPVVSGNIVNNCDDGIVLTGIAGSTAPHAVQLASSLANLNNPSPIPVNIGFTALTRVSTSAPSSLNFSTVVVQNYSPPSAYPIVPVSTQAELTNPNGACSAITPITGKIGIAYADGSCVAQTKTLNVEGGGGVATILATAPGVSFGENTYQNSPVTGNGITVQLSTSNSTALINAITANPSTIVTIQTFPATLNNLTRGNSTQIIGTQSAQESLHLLDSVDLLGWEFGDQVQYVAGSIPISGLVDGNTYYLISYVLGYTTGALVSANQVNKCRRFGIRDDSRPCTDNVYLDNTVVCCGETHDDNYAIEFSGRPPISKRDNKNSQKELRDRDNVSIVCVSGCRTTNCN